MRFLLLLPILLISLNAQAILLQSPVKNMDKRDSYLIPSFDKKSSNYNLNLELNYIQNPLIQANSFSGSTSAILEGLMGVEVGANWFMTESFSMGAMLPMVKPMGVESYESILLGPIFELRWKIGSFMIIPSYQLPSETLIPVSIGGSSYDMPLGAKSGVMGARVVYDVGSIGDIKTKIFTGFYQAPDNRFLNVDETSHILGGVSASLPLEDSLSLNGDILADKTPENNIVQGLAYFNYKTLGFSLQTGAGTDLTASGSNTLKAFFNLTYNFGSENKKGKGFYFPESGSKTPGKEIKLDVPKKENQTPRQEENMDDEEQNAPRVLEPEQAPKYNIQDEFIPGGENTIYDKEEKQ